MKKVLLLAMGLMSTFAFANEQSPQMNQQEQARKQEMFAKHKSLMLEEIKVHENLLQQKYNCIQSAQSPEAIKQCHEQFQNSLKQQMEQHKAKAEQMRQQEMEAHKQKMMEHENQRRAEFDKKMQSYGKK